MAHFDMGWEPVIAERERSASSPDVTYPCRGPFNRYMGCVGARRCRSTGVSVCVTGKWPDEPKHSGTRHVQVSRAPDPAMQERRTAAVTAASGRSVKPAPPAGATPQRLVSIYHGDHRMWHLLSKEIKDAGFFPVLISDESELRAALARGDRPSAVLIDATLAHSEVEGETLLSVVEASEVPVLTLPSTLRADIDATATARMAVLWLAVTLRHLAS